MFKIKIRLKKNQHSINWFFFLNIGDCGKLIVSFIYLFFFYKNAQDYLIPWLIMTVWGHRLKAHSRAYIDFVQV